MYQIQYRCLYREHWYDYDTADTWNEAVRLAGKVEAVGRKARIATLDGIVVYQTP